MREITIEEREQGITHVMHMPSTPYPESSIYRFLKWLSDNNFKIVREAEPSEEGET